MAEPLHLQPARFGKLVAHREASPPERFSEAISFRSVSISMCRTPLHVGGVGTSLKYARARVACAAVLAIASLVACAAGARAQTFNTPIDISGDAPGGQPLIAVDAKNDIDVAWSSGKGVFFTRSTDGGKTFAAPATVATGAGNAALQMNVDRSGTVYLLWQRGDSHFLLSRSADGASFSLPTDLTAALNMVTFSADQPAMAIDASGNIDLVWAQFGATGAVMFRRSSDGGSTFSSPVEVGKFLHGAEAQIALGSLSDINILWSEQTTDAGAPCVLHFSRSTDSGDTFSPILTLNNPDGECDAKFVVDSGDNISVVAFNGRGTFYRSTDGGKTFSNSQEILKPATVARAGKLYADLPGNIKTLVRSVANHDLLFAGSRDGGATFSAPITVGPSHPAPAAEGEPGGNVPSIAVDSHGNVNVAWQDDVVTPGAADILFSRSADGGASFSAAQNVSRGSATSSPGMAVDTAGNINIVWTAGSARKVLFARASASAADSGFTISVTPASLMALPGGTAKGQLTLTATGGFGQVVTLSCGGLPVGADCTFNPVSVTPSVAGSTVTVVLTIPPTLSVGGFPFTVNAASATLSQFQPMQISVGVLVGSVTPSAMTIPAGGSATFAVTVASTSFGGQFSLACNAPASVKCTFNPGATFLPVDGRVASTLTVQVLSTPTTGSVPANPKDVLPPRLRPVQRLLSISGLLILLLSMLAFPFIGGKRRGFGFGRTVAGVFGCIALTVVMASCGGALDKTKRIGSGSGTVGTGGTSGIAGTGGTGGMGGTGGSAGAGGTTSGGVSTLGNTSVTFPLGVVAQAGGSAVNVGTITLTVP